MLVYFSCWEKHLRHLQAVMLHLKEHGLIARSTNCQFEIRCIEYLGHIIGNGIVAVLEYRTLSMQSYVQPIHKWDTRDFTGAVTYYRKFTPGFHKYSAVSKSAPSKGGVD